MFTLQLCFHIATLCSLCNFVFTFATLCSHCKFVFTLQLCVHIATLCSHWNFVHQQLHVKGHRTPVSECLTAYLRRDKIIFVSRTHFSADIHTPNAMSDRYICNDNDALWRENGFAVYQKVTTWSTWYINMQIPASQEKNTLIIKSYPLGTTIVLNCI